MTELVIVGQAPSRIGDGRPFSGPSGKRLAALFGLRDYEQLAASMTLINIFGNSADRREVRGDHFDRDRARQLGEELVELWRGHRGHVIVIACGHSVFQALTGQRGTFYQAMIFSEEASHIEVWCFPHPSGASSYWNEVPNRLTAANFLRRILKRSGIDMAR